MPEVFSGLLAADAMVALEHDGRVPIPLEQLVVVRLVEQAKAVDRGRLALPLGADVDPLDGRRRSRASPSSQAPRADELEEEA